MEREKMKKSPSSFTAWLLIVVGVVMLIVFAGKNGLTGGLFSLGTKNVNEEETFAAGAFKNLVVDTDSTDVHVVRGSSDEIRLRLEGTASENIADQIQLKAEPQSGDTLKVRVQTSKGFHFGVTVMDVGLTVELPEKAWDSMKVKSDSGDVDVEDWKGNKADIQAESGDIKLRSIESQQISLRADSGDLTVDRFKADRLEFDVDNGDVRLTGGQSALQGKTNSGDIRVVMDELLHDTDLRADSGDVVINLSQQPKSAAVDYQGGSGQGKVQWDGMTYQEKSNDEHRFKGVFGAGGVKVKVRTSSGDFTLGRD